MNNTICVIKNTEGKEVGRIAATAPNAAQYLQLMAETHGGCSVEHEEDKDAAMISRMLSPLNRAGWGGLL